MFADSTLQAGAVPATEPPPASADFRALRPEMAGEKAELATAADHDGLSAVVHSIMSGNVPCGKFLLEAGASPNTVDGMGMTPLHHCVMCGAPEDAVDALLAAGADVNVKDSGGKTAAEYCENEGLKKKLLEAAADPARTPAPAFAPAGTVSEAAKNAIKDAACSGNLDQLKALLA